MFIGFHGNEPAVDITFHYIVVFQMSKCKIVFKVKSQTLWFLRFTCSDLVAKLTGLKRALAGRLSGSNRLSRWVTWHQAKSIHYYEIKWKAFCCATFFSSGIGFAVQAAKRMTEEETVRIRFRLMLIDRFGVCRCDLCETVESIWLTASQYLVICVVLWWLECYCSTIIWIKFFQLKASKRTNVET